MMDFSACFVSRSIEIWKYLPGIKNSMLLEDFFPLFEMKDGLATLARVEEHVGVMEEKEILEKCR